GMTMNGAKGETYEEMKETLAFYDLDLTEINEGYQYLIELLSTVDPKVQMEIANSVWSRLGFEVEEEFMEALREYFNAEARELDFSDPAAVDIINGWISDKTHEKIPKVLDEIPENVVMYLINAVYFNGSWKYEFDPEVTKEQNFYLENGESVQAEMMSQQNHFAHYITDDVQMIDLPYGDSLFTMTLLMPGNSETPLDEFIASDLTSETLDGWYQQLSSDTVGVYLPKLELEYKIPLNEVLKEMGMTTAFTGNADFTGINSGGGLFISRVLHNTYLNMDEEGTEAAGVTVVEIGITSVGPQIPVIRFNRPYVMIIREQSSGTILFMGKIKNPAI
ncbi:MAG: serpin family protein, partial [Gracilimonas sp.]